MNSLHSLEQVKDFLEEGSSDMHVERVPQDEVEEDVAKEVRKNVPHERQHEEEEDEKEAVPVWIEGKGERERRKEASSKKHLQ